MYSDKQIWNVSYPIILSLLAQNIVNITDTAFLGRVSEIELGASALGGVFYLAVYMLGFGFSTGAQILMARRNGEGREKEIAPYFIQGVAFLLAFTCVVLFSTALGMKPLLGLIIKSDQVFDATMRFLDWRMWGIMFAFVNVMFRAFYVGITKTRALTVSALVMAVVNIVLDYILIFGKFGFPQLGIEGAAIASVIAEVSAVLFMVVYTLVSIDLKQYGFLNKSAFNMRQLPHLLSISVWTMLQYFGAVGTWFIFFLATESLGERSLAVSNIVRSISTMLFMPVSAYGTTANTLVSNLMGENHASHVPRLIWRIIRQCLYIALPLILIVILFPRLIMGIYTDDQTLISASLPSLWVWLVSCLFMIPGSVIFQFISGTGNTRSALAVETGTLVFYMLYIGIMAFYLRFPVEVCWGSEILYWLVLFVLSIVYLYRADWQSKKI